MIPHWVRHTRDDKFVGGVRLGLGLTLPGVVAVPPNDPGPFHPLILGYAGQDYSDALPSGARYTLDSGDLPRGLTLSSSGRVSCAQGSSVMYGETKRNEKNVVLPIT